MLLPKPTATVAPQRDRQPVCCEESSGHCLEPHCACAPVAAQAGSLYPRLVTEAA